MSTINTELSMMRELAGGGVAPPSDRVDLLRKAYRLREFGRCPRCDQHLTMFDAIIKMQWELSCICGWETTISHRAVVDIDETLLETVANI